jgi:hypothetical protein
MSLAPVKEKLKKLIRLLPPDLAGEVQKVFEKYSFVPDTERERMELMDTIVGCAIRAVVRAFKDGILTEYEATDMAVALNDLTIDLAEEWYHRGSVYRLEQIVEDTIEILDEKRKYVEWVREQWESVESLFKD